MLAECVERLPAVASGFHLRDIDAIHPRLIGVDRRVCRVVLEHEFKGARERKAL